MYHYIIFESRKFQGCPKSRQHFHNFIFRDHQPLENLRISAHSYAATSSHISTSGIVHI